MTATDSAEREQGKRYWERHAQKYDLSMRLIGKPMPRMVVPSSGTASRFCKRAASRLSRPVVRG